MNKRTIEKIHGLKIGTRIGALIGLIICLVLLFFVSKHTDFSNINKAFKISDEDTEQKYGIIVDQLNNAQYLTNMIKNEDNTYSISGEYEKYENTASAYVKISENGKILEHTINTKISISNLHDSNKMSDIFTEFNAGLCMDSYNIKYNEFKSLVNDAQNYKENKHGQYEGEIGIYTVWCDDEYVYINYNKK